MEWLAALFLLSCPRCRKQPIKLMSQGSLSFCKGKKINQECYLVTNWGLFDKISYILYLTEANGQFLKAE